MKSFALYLLTAFTVLAQWANSPFPSEPPEAGYVLQNAFPSLSFALPDQLVGLKTNAGRLFVVDQGGRVYVITNLATPTKTVFLDNRADCWAVAESGLMGLAFHPSGNRVFIWANETNRTTRTMVNRLSRWTVDPANRNRVLPSSKVVLIEQLDQDRFHSGGDIEFGPDGYLYVPLGDEGGGNGVMGNAQRIDRDFFSGILRLDVDELPGNLTPNPHPAVRGGYRIPRDNPWVGATSFNSKPVTASAVRTEFWAVGFRNPHRMSFDTNGDLYAGDVGGLRWEEFNRIVRGGNYGWNWMEGNETTVFPQAPPATSRPPVNFVAPFWTYPHTSIAPPGTDPRFIGNCAIGGFVYRGSRYPSLNGKYLGADWASKHIWAITLSPQIEVERIATARWGVNAFGMNPLTGDILVIENKSGIVSKLVTAPVTAGVPATLSATGTFTDLSSMTPADGILPYEVASPFWSDHATKTRWFYLPPGGTVSRDAGDNWAFPAGTVWVKHFDLPLSRGTTLRRKIETRFFVKTADGGYGLTYRWRADQSNADLVSDAGADVNFTVQDAGISKQQSWHYPARSECVTCHNPVAGDALGFSTRQLNLPVQVEGGGTVNQLLGLSALGVFKPGFSTIAGLPRLSKPLDGTFSLEHRFKSYTDVNCAYCHQPGAPGRGDWDARFSTPVSESSIINGAVIDDLGITGASIITPGVPALSVLFRRVSDFSTGGAPAEYHMPPLATQERDAPAADLLWKYILSLNERTLWTIGTNGPASRPFSEFSAENGRNDAAPGSPLRLDDDFYFAGDYPAGFNRLTARLQVARDEPSAAWEWAHTATDKTNRVHFILAPSQVTSQSTFLLSFGLVFGGSSIGGIRQPGFADHDIVVRFRNSLGVTTQLFSKRVSQSTNIEIPFAASAVGATAGANTLEIVRTGPSNAGVSYWIQYDYLRLESRPPGNTPPVLVAPAGQEVNELSLLSFGLIASDSDRPAQALTYSRVSGPAGLTVSGNGIVSWIPTEAQGPRVYDVVVRVTDNGLPALSDTRSFAVVVHEVPDSIARTVWQIGTDNNPLVIPYRPTAEFSIENFRNDPPPGRVTRLAGDPQYVAATNPAADDDFYFKGGYPAGFNGLLSLLTVPNDEPPAAWERAHTATDKTNRVHFILDPTQVTGQSTFLLSFELVFGGSSIRGTQQPGFADHDIVVRFRNSLGVATQLFSRRISQSTNIVIPFAASAVGATAGANTLEIVRTGPSVAGVSYWIQYDYLRLESPPAFGGAISRQRTSLGGGAITPARIGTVRTEILTVDGSDFLAITFDTSERASLGQGYTVEVSDDLEHWSTYRIDTADRVPGGSAQPLSVQALLPLGEVNMRFLRLRFP